MFAIFLCRLQDVLNKLQGAAVAVNFSSIAESLTPALDVVRIAIGSGMIDLVDESMSQLSNVNKTIYDATYETTEDVKKQCKSAEEELESAMNGVRWRPRLAQWLVH
jgi:hypothetical protein